MDRLSASFRHCCTSFFSSLLFLGYVNTGEFNGVHWGFSSSFDTYFFFRHDIDHGAMSLCLLLLELS